MLARNPADLVVPPSAHRKEMVTLDPEQLRRLLAHADPLYGPVFYLAAYTGMRRGELTGLKWADVDLDNGVVSVVREIVFVPGIGHIETPPKSAKSRRTIAITPGVVGTLRIHRATQIKQRLSVGPAWTDKGWVFTRADGRHVIPNRISRAFKCLREELDLPPVRFHDLRHTYASIMLRGGVHLKVVQDILGHSTITLTADTYSHVAPSMQRMAAETFESELAR